MISFDMPPEIDKDLYLEGLSLIPNDCPCSFIMLIVFWCLILCVLIEQKPSSYGRVITDMSFSNLYPI